MQTGHTTTSTDDNQAESGTERSSREGQSIRHRDSTRKKKNTRIAITFKGNLPEVGAVIGAKEENYKESFQNLQESALK